VSQGVDHDRRATAPRSAHLFRAEDRCDRCSAAARVLVLLHASGELALCKHHANRHRAALESISLIIEQQEATR
jgi:hypothetical protein